MKLTLKTLGILTVVAFILSPIISPIPGVILIISMGFLWLSKQNNPENIAEFQEEEKENDTIITDLEDKIIIIEKKTLYKKDMSYADCRKYNLKNVNCIGDCKSFEASKTKHHYKDGHKHCTLCNVWMIVDKVNCPCCSSKLRV